MKLNEEKLAELSSMNDVLDQKYGKEGTESRAEFDAKAQSWYYAELLKQERKRQKMSQEELAKAIGKKRPYISALEKGKTDMQLSTFLMISKALGLTFSLVVA